ncbi:MULTISPECIES: type I restriction enzyme HsdR N-terminal domain-containing protein [Olivibacter]|jgi:type I site-specific restriction endonuclease|uniref:Restriction endonuclease, type I, R subunit/Type III n=2 Tax=Sphingobacteriaceae TaxID=84566 RepID=F4CEB7_SPHS2|nr:type I restriction enzyme HsdR N-terminal domain-containing protein [Olivibacter sp. 47]MDM8176242.1 type I restriction enzyme HsdR N-terminal domain-containing protein [Olivibacter sp. 47]
MLSPIPLNLPSYPLKLSKDEHRLFIYDELRKKHLLLTPEEWVRQHWIQHLIQAKGFPKALIQSEGGLKLNSLQKRTDIVVFNPSGKRLLIAELKAPSIKITQAVFEQIARYNMVHKVPYLVVSNGLEHYYCLIDHENESYRFLEDIPFYHEIK